MARERKPRSPKNAAGPLVPDAELWSDLTRSIEPLRPQRAKSSARALDAAAPEAADDTAPGTLPPPAPSAPPAPAPAPAPPSRQPSAVPAPPAFTGLDRRARQRLSRGQAAIDARLDLHGLGIAAARQRLKAFLTASQAQGARMVLVITGKGASPFARHTLHGRDIYHAPERTATLRRLVPEWLHEREFALLVAGFQPAHPRHGGGGALYVKLRRTR